MHVSYNFFIKDCLVIANILPYMLIIQFVLGNKCWARNFHVSSYKSAFYYNRDKYKTVNNTKKYKEKTPTTKCRPKTKASTISKGFQAKMSCVQRL